MAVSSEVPSSTTTVSQRSPVEARATARSVAKVASQPSCTARTKESCGGRAALVVGAWHLVAPLAASAVAAPPSSARAGGEARAGGAWIAGVAEGPQGPARHVVGAPEVVVDVEVGAGHHLPARAEVGRPPAGAVLLPGAAAEPPGVAAVRVVLRDEAEGGEDDELAARAGARWRRGASSAVGFSRCSMMSSRKTVSTAPGGKRVTASSQVAWMGR